MGIRSLLRNAFGRSRTATAERDEASPRRSAPPSVPAPAQEPDPEPRAEPRTEPRSDSGTDIGIGTGPLSASGSAPRTEPRTESRTEPLVARPRTSTEETAAEPAPAPEPVRAPVPPQQGGGSTARLAEPLDAPLDEPDGDRIPDPGPLEPTPQPGPTPGPRPGPGPVPPEPSPEPEPQPTPVPTPTPVPQPEPVPPVDPEPVPEPAPGPDPVRKPEPAPGPPMPEPSPAMPPREAAPVQEEAPAQPAAQTTAPAAISLQKLETRAPGLISLYKEAGASLEKQGLTGQRAAVYLVLDRSGSMREFYKNGTVQHLAEQALGLSAHLDDDGTVPVVFFSTDVDGVAEVDLGNYEGRIEELHSSMGHMGRTNYHWAMEAVIGHYKKSGSTAPAFVIFQTDGGPYSKPAAERALCESSNLPIFWQFVAFGDPEGKGFDFLRKLDDLPVPEKRVVDNAGFFHAGRDPKSLTDAQLYAELMVEFPDWLKEARAAGIVEG
ncbi:VWA domain-containing protein [Streptomyces klenkii]|uniref:VWA domain-containing protein n=1 Tax=Streptomyces klenkii TaxID=1420899 RepID=UPI0036DFA998